MLATSQFESQDGDSKLKFKGIISFIAMLALCVPTIAQDSGVSPAANEEAKKAASRDVDSGQLSDDQAELLLQNGLDYLVDVQQNDGSFPDEGVSHIHRSGIVALSTLAWLQNGDHKYKVAAKRGMSFLVKRDFPNAKLRSPFVNYEDAVVMIALLEGVKVWGDEYAPAAKKYVDTFVERQQENGAWSYSPKHFESSIVSLALHGLISARQLKFEVPDDTFEKGSRYLLSRYIPARRSFGNFWQDSPTYGATGITLSVLQRLGDYASEEVREGLRKFRGTSVDSSTENLVGAKFEGYAAGKYHFELNAHALALRFSRHKEHLQSWLPEVRQRMAEQVKEDGSWDGWFGHPYGTALACLVLQMDQPSRLQLLKRVPLNLAAFKDKTGIAWRGSFNEALAIAKRQKRLLLIKPVSIHLDCNDSW